MSKRLTFNAHGTVIWHRPIEIRPRDQARCDCVLCFGICAETHYDLSYEFNKIKIPPTPTELGNPVVTLLKEIDDGFMNFYLLEAIAWSEPLIVIDEDVFFKVIEDNSDIKLLAGEYMFENTSGVININGSNFQYFGYFTGRIE